MRKLFAMLLPLAVFTVACGDDNSNTPLTVTVPDLGTIADARASALHTRVHIQGFVSVAPATFFSSTGDVGFAIQDPTGGIYISTLDMFDFYENSKVDVVGDLANASGAAVVISNTSGIVLRDGTEAVVPKVVKTGEVNESTEGLLVRVTGKVTKPVVDDKPYGIEAFVDDGSGEIRIYVNLNGTAPLVDTGLFVVGNTVQLTGLSSQYDSTFEIAPRNAGDLVAM